MKQTLINIFKFLLFLSIGLGLLYWAYQTPEKEYQKKEACAQYYAGISLDECQPTEAQLQEFKLKDKLAEDFGNVNYIWIILAVLAFIISNISRALRWNMLIKPLGTTPRTINSFMAVMIGYMANSVIPRSGEVFRCGVLSRYEKVTADKLIGTVATSRGIDMICLLAAIGLMLLLQYEVVGDFLANSLNSDKEAGLLSNPWVQGFLALSVLGGVLFLVFRKHLLKYTLFKKLWGLVLGVWTGMKTIREVDQPIMFVVHTVVIWTMYYFMTYLAFFSFEPVSNLGPVVGLTIFVFGSLGMVIPAPGGIGAYQYLVSLALVTFYGILDADAFSFANILFFPIFFTNISLGVLSMILFPLLNKGREQTILETQG